MLHKKKYENAPIIKCVLLHLGEGLIMEESEEQQIRKRIMVLHLIALSVMAGAVIFLGVALYLRQTKETITDGYSKLLQFRSADTRGPWNNEGRKVNP